MHAVGLLVLFSFPIRIKLTSFSSFSKCIPGATCVCASIFFASCCDLSSDSRKVPAKDKSAAPAA